VGASGNKLEIDAGTVNAAAGNGRGVYLTSKRGSTLNSITATDGTVDIDSQTGDITVNAIAAGTGTVTLNSAGNILDANSTAIDVTSGHAFLTAANLIGTSGNKLELGVSTLAATVGTGGGVFVSSANGVTLAAILAPGGTVDVDTQAGDITVNSVNAGTG